MVDDLATWYVEHQTALAERGIVAVLKRSPDDGRDKASAWLSVERGSVGGQITVWDTGECELGTGARACIARYRSAC